MRTLILTHGDTDGICSGALALAANPRASVYFTSPVSVLEELAHAADYDRVIISDVAINISMADNVKDTLDSLAAGREVVYIDHHPRPDGFTAPWLVHDTDACGSLLTYSHFRDRLDPDMSRVAMYGAIGDYRDNTPIAQELVRKWDRRSLYYEAGTLSQGVEMERHNYGFNRELVLRLAKNELPSEIRRLAKMAIVASRLEDELRARVQRDVIALDNIAYVIDPDGFISKAAIYARIYGRRPVGISAEYRESRHVYDISVRAEGDFDLNRVLNDTAVQSGGHGGGHPQAGGGRIPANRLKEFLSSLDAAIGAVAATASARTMSSA